MITLPPASPCATCTAVAGGVRGSSTWVFYYFVFLKNEISNFFLVTSVNVVKMFVEIKMKRNVTLIQACAAIIVPMERCVWHEWA